MGCFFNGVNIVCNKYDALFSFSVFLSVGNCNCNKSNILGIQVSYEYINFMVVVLVNTNVILWYQMHELIPPLWKGI